MADGRGVLVHCLAYVGMLAAPGREVEGGAGELLRAATLLSALAPEAIRTVRVVAGGFRAVALVAAVPGAPADTVLAPDHGCVLLCGPVCGAGGPDAWAGAVLAGHWETLAGQDGTYCAAAWIPRAGLALGQDRYGLRPQYRFHRADGSVWFASALRALAVMPELSDPSLNWESQMLQAARLPRDGEMSVIMGPERSRGGNGALVDRKDRTTRFHVSAPPYGQIEPVRQKAGELVETLNDALLRRLGDMLAQKPATVPTGVLLSGGLDSRWIAAALRHLGQPYTAYAIGGRLDADVDQARLACHLHGVPITVGDLDRHGPTMAAVGSAIWWQDGAISPYHHLVGDLWPALQASGPLLMHGYFQNWVKWDRPRFGHLLPRAISRRQDRAQSRQRAGEIYEKLVRLSRLEVLFPGCTVRTREAVARHLDRRTVASGGDAVALLATDCGPHESFTALGRYGYALGGGVFPLLGVDSLRALRATVELPVPQRIRIQARCILALAPEEADLPTMRFCLPTRVLAAGYGALPGYLARDPGWFARWRAVARHPSPETTRLLRLRDPTALAWAQRLLFAGDSQALDHFRGRLSEFWRAATAPDASWRAVSLLYGLAGREYYRRCWRRAAAGDSRPWESEPGPGSDSRL